MNVDTLPQHPTSAALRSASLTSTQVRRIVDSGGLIRVAHGVYTRGPSGAHGSDSWHSEYLRRAEALCWALPGSYLVGPTAAVACRLPLLNRPERVHLSRVERVRSRRSQVETHAAWPHGFVPDLPAAVPVQGVTAAVVEIAAREGVLAGLVTADAASARGLLGDAEQVLEVWGSRRGARAAREVMVLTDGRHESPLETQAAWQGHLEGIELEPQTDVFDENGGWVARVDFTVDGLRLAVEVDGMVKYRHPDDFAREKARQGQLEELGWTVVRVTAQDLRFGRFIPRLRAAMARASAR